MYVDYNYYVNEYSGGMSEEEFQSSERKAEAYIRSITYISGNIFEVEDIAVKKAVCSVADVYHAFDLKKKRQKNGTVKSENNDGFSVSYVTEQVDGQTEEELIRKKAYEAARMYLLPTGWLSRRVGCRYDHQCRYHGL